MKYNKVIIFFSIISLFFLLPYHLITAAINEYIEYSEIMEAGTYPITVYDKYNKNEKVIYITILYPRTVVNAKYHEAIDAFDAYIPQNIFYDLSDQEIINITKARAWNIEENVELKVIVKNRILKDAQSGWYSVIFTTEKGTETIVNIIEVAEDVLTINNLSNFVDFMVLNDYHTTWIFVTLLIILPTILLCIIKLYISYYLKYIKKLLYNNDKY